MPNMLIVYEKSNGDMFFRLRKTMPITNGKDRETSMGWKVINVLYEYDGNYYKEETYREMMKQRYLRQKKEKKRFIKFLIRKLQKIAYN